MDNVYIIEIKTIDKQSRPHLLVSNPQLYSNNKSFQRIFPHEEQWRLGSCPQDTVGLVVLRGLSLSASNKENQSSFGLTSSLRNLDV
ncbi:hypothetical protein NC653_028434 [Populus alba x Populus x berolinensis]|uniref:Uncharacterized protein n=1 Tax=Populus alba x Populus x berolinensis TaxID=444605 RepID=A0AAD6M8U0_9ROSI|nr:hypothetical protein NC653_028434 [Populus alba x Populus x berolinensis]